MRKWIHKLIRAYLEDNGGVIHTGPYGSKGRYIIVITPMEYLLLNSARAEYTLDEVSDG